MTQAATEISGSRPHTGRSRMTMRMGYLLGSLGPSLGFQLVTLLVLRFMTDSLAISAAVAGVLLALTKFFDAVFDPTVGWLSDRTRTPIGRRRPYFLAGAILIPLSTAAIFNVPHIETTATIAFLTIFLLLHSAGYSAFTVPYVASASENTDDYHERSVLMSFRVYGLTLGFSLASTGAPWLLAFWDSGRVAHADMSLIMSGIMLVVMLIAVRLIPEPRHDGKAQPKISVAARLRAAWDNKPFRTIIMAHMGFMVGVGAVTVCTAYFTRQVLQLSDMWLGSFFLSKTIGTLVAVPGWLWLAKRWDKKRAYILAVGIYGLFNLSWLLASASEPLPLMFIRMFCLGIAMAGCVLLASSIITDVIRYDTMKTGIRQEGAFAGVVAFVDKTFQAVGVSFVGILLSSMGYIASTRGMHVQQPPSAITGIYIGFAATPAVASLLCLLAMLGYRLKESDFAGKTSANTNS